MKNFLSRFKFQVSFDRDASKWRANPPRDWKITFFVFTTAVICITAVQFYVFLYVSYTEVFFPTVVVDRKESVGASINQKGLSQVVAGFNAKKEQMDKLLNEPLQVSDPSGRESLAVPVTIAPVSAPKTSTKTNTSTKGSDGLVLQ